MRDYRKLEAFQLADDLTLAIYRVTSRFPLEERFLLANQLRKAAVSTASNIVEGCSRHTEADFLHLLDVAYGSAREAGYQLSVAKRLGYVTDPEAENAETLCSRTCRALAGLTRALRSRPCSGRRPRTADRRPAR